MKLLFGLTLVMLVMVAVGVSAAHAAEAPVETAAEVELPAAGGVALGLVAAACVVSGVVAVRKRR